MRTMTIRQQYLTISLHKIYYRELLSIYAGKRSALEGTLTPLLCRCADALSQDAGIDGCVAVCHFVVMRVVLVVRGARRPYFALSRTLPITTIPGPPEPF